MKMSDKSKEELLKELKTLKKENAALKAVNGKNIYKRKGEKETFRISEEDYIELFENHSAVNLIIDPDTGDIFNANKAAAEYYGWSCDELREMKIQQINIMPPEEIKVNMLKTKNHNKFHFEFRHKRADGSIRDVEVFSANINISHRKYLYSIIFDITERKDAEYLLKKLQEDLQILLDNIPAWIFYKDTENRFVHVNKPYADVMGIAKEKLEGKSIFDLFPKEQAEAFWKDDKEVISTGKPKLNIIEQMDIPNRTIWVQTDKIPFLNDQGDIVGIIGFIIDITERKAADDKIQKMNEVLKELNLTKDKFFSIIAHDLKSPFLGLIGYSQILLEEYETLSEDEKKDSIKSIYEICRHTFGLLDNLLVWSRMQTGKMTFDPDVFNIYQELLPTIELLIHTAKKKNITIDYLIDKRTIVLADKNMMTTIIRNLISNAIKYTNPGGKIIVISERMDKNLELSVADNGVGIRENVLNNLFKIDQNVSAVGTADEEGTGLGLILCKEMIQMHKGKIRVESEVGKGSKFTFSVPLRI